MEDEELSDLEKRKRHIAMNDEWTVWRKQALKLLDDLKPRINALEGRQYHGCGFHYAMVQDYWGTGSLIANNIAIKEDEIEIPVIAEVRLEALIDSIEKAEAYFEGKNKEEDHGKENLVEA
jgi:hypothetical protein